MPGMTTGKMESLRLFYALWPDDKVRAAVAGLQMSIAEGRMTRPQNLHMTLAFLGLQASELLPILKTILKQVSTPGIALELDRIGYFVNKRIAWARLHQVPDALLELQRGLMQKLLQQGISFDHQAQFKPHVTLAREASPPAEILFSPIPWHANQIALVQSISQPDGVHYRVLASRQLQPMSQ